MSYQVLARKWRPQTFDDVVGQSHVVTPLRNAIRSDRVPHAILFTGPRGVGKTTFARILARCLNCEKGPTDTPCGTCPSCDEISRGTSTDVQEIDAASRTSVDDVREVIEAIRYAPSPGKHRIFVVDEVHMLSTQAFNALLKTLEEPPPRSLFVFATTNPEKIPFTVISRCQRHDLRRIATDEITDRMRHIAKSEGITISDESLRAISRESDGSLRDAQTLLDQVIAFGGESVDDTRVAEMLDLIDRRLLVGILEACVDADPARVLVELGKASNAGVDAKRLGANLLELLRDLVVLKIAPEEEGLVEGNEDQIAELAALSERSEIARLRRMFRALLVEQQDLAWAPQPFAVLEMALVRLATSPAGEDVSTLLSRLDALEHRLAGGDATPPAKSGSGGGSVVPRDPAPAPRAGKKSSVSSADAEVAPAETTQTIGPPEADAPLPVVFDRLREFVRKAQPNLAATLDDAELLARTPDALRLRARHDFGTRRLRKRAEALEAECERFFGAPVRIDVVTDEAGDGEVDTGASAPDDGESVRRVRQEALSHPGVNAALQHLGGEIVEIRPLGGSEKR